VLFLKNNNFSKASSLKRLRLGTRICPAALNKRSTGADDGIVVLYFKNTLKTAGQKRS